jgi:inosose dehydratase
MSRWPVWLAIQEIRISWTPQLARFRKPGETPPADFRLHGQPEVAGWDSAHRENLSSHSVSSPARTRPGRCEASIIETILGGQPGEWEASNVAMASKLKEWAATAAAEQILIAIKPHVRNAMQSPAQAEWLRARVASPWLRFTYDYSHFQLQGLSLQETLQTLVPHTAFVHVKDAAGTAEQPQFQLPGAGAIDYVSLLRLLKKLGYRGSVTVEVSAQINRMPG